MHARSGPGPSIGYISNTTCDLCRQAASCAVIRCNERADVVLCWSCLMQATSAIAGHKKPSKRPHKKPCTCMECGAFDLGQVPEPVAATERKGEGEPQTRAPWLEIDR